MLDALRKASESGFGRAIMAIVLGLLVVSFVIWGIGDIFSGFGSDKLAQVSGVQITTQDYRTAYERQLNQMQQQEKRPITAGEAHAMGLDAQVLSSLIANAVLDEQARRLGLAMSDKDVAHTIFVDPTFKGADGKFDSNAFNSVLQQNGLTEATFVKEQRGLQLRREIAEAMIGNLSIPNAMLDAVDQFRNETRSIDDLDLPASAAGDIPAPTDKELQTYFDARREQWRAPEYRSLIVLNLTPSSVADPNKISDQAARAAYDANKASYGAPEKRQVLQGTFPTQQGAAAAVAKITGGSDFAAAVKDGGGTLVDLGLVERTALFDPKTAQAAFSAADGGVSAPIQSQFGWVLVKVVKTQAATIKPFADVGPSIKNRLALQQASAAIATLRDRIEDQRTAGNTLTQSAQSVGLKTQKFDSVDAQGADKSGKPVTNLPDKEALLKAAFASDVGMDNDILTTPDGGDLWFEVSNVDPAHDRTLAEVKPQVEIAWRRDQVAQRLAEKGKELVGKLNAGASIADLAKTYNVQARTITDVKRIGAADAPAPLIAQVFNVPVGGSGSAATAPQTRTVFKVNDSETPPVDPNSDVNKAITANLRQQMSDDLLSAYLNALQNQMGVSVNQAAITSVVSGNSQP